jgi:AmmeMemoRadiSam system protein B/AmmeMemoRadiSam system protein A
MAVRPRFAVVFVAFVVTSGLGSGSCRRDGSAGSAVAATAPAGVVRQPTHAGSWYPADPATLRADLERLLAAGGSPRPGGPVLAGIVPHAGLRYSGGVAATFYAALRGQTVRRVFLLGPSHHVAFDGIALPAPEVTAYGTPLGDLTLDREVLQTLRGKPGFGGPPAAHGPEHSLEMEVIFLAAVAPRALLVPLVVGRVGGPAEAKALARELLPLVGRDDVVIASSDFTHYGPSFSYVPFVSDVPARLAELADHATAALVAADAHAFQAHLEQTRDTICGREPIMLLLALLPSETRGERLAFDTSGRMTTFESSVSYVSIAYPSVAKGAILATGDHAAVAASRGPPVLDAAQQRFALALTRRTLEVVLGGGAPPDAAALAVPGDAVWAKPYGTFVTLKHRGELRGCIGHIFPVEPLWQDLRDNAVSSALHDPRFPAVSRGELAGLELEVSILTEPRVVPGPDGFEVGRHGVVLTAQGRRAVFLPQVAPEQGWDRETTLHHLSLKAGLAGDAWRSPDARFEVFEAQVFGESAVH